MAVHPSLVACKQNKGGKNAKQRVAVLFRKLPGGNINAAMVIRTEFEEESNAAQNTGIRVIAAGDRGVGGWFSVWIDKVWLED